MDEPLRTLCIITDEVWVDADWTIIGIVGVRPRKMHACLMNIYSYNDKYETVNIVDWSADPIVHVEETHTYGELVDLLSKLMPEGKDGLLVHSGSVDPRFSKLEPTLEHGWRKYRYKMCMKDFSPMYSASLASVISELWGFSSQARDPFILGWFPEDDPVKDAILRKWDEWPDSKCDAMLPPSPSLSDRSVELIRVGDDADGIGIFLGEELHQDLSLERLREILPEDAILARVKDRDFWDWLDNWDLDELIPVDRELPFQAG